MIDASTLIARGIRLWLYTFFIIQFIALFFIVYVIKVLWSYGGSIERKKRELLIYLIGASLSYIIFSTIGILLINLKILATLNNLFLWAVITIFVPLVIGIALQYWYRYKYKFLFKKM